MPNEEGVTLRHISPEEAPKNIEAIEPPPGPPVDRAVADALRLIGVNPSGTIIETPAYEPEPLPGETPPAAPETPPATPPPETPPATPPATPPTPVTPPPAPSPRTSALTKAAEKLEAVADKLARAATPAAPAPAPPPEAPTPESLRIEALRLLETDAKSKYRGQNIVQKYTEYETKWKGYREKWELEHPNDSFDPDDEAHDSFRDRHEPDIEESDIIRAEARIEARRDAEEALAAQRVEFAQERIRENAKTAAREAASLLAPQKPDGTPKLISEIEAEDPALADAIEEALPATQRLAKLAHEMFTPGTATTWDRNNPEHRTLLGLVGSAEDNLSAQDPSTVTFEGRRFVTAKEWNQLSRAEQQEAWTPAQEPRVVEILLGNHLRAGLETRAKALRERYTKRATKYGAAPAPAPTPAPAVPAPAPAPTATPPAGGTGLQAPTTVPGAGVTPSGIDYFFGSN